MTYLSIEALLKQFYDNQPSIHAFLKNLSSLQKLTHGPQMFTEKTLNFMQIYPQSKILRKSPSVLSRSIHGPCILTKNPSHFKKIFPQPKILQKISPTVGRIRNQAFRMLIREIILVNLVRFKRLSCETPRALKSCFIFQNPSFGQYLSSGRCCCLAKN
jgi:hypothetical protein